MTVGCWYPQHTSVLTVMPLVPLAQKKAIAAVRLAAAPIECNTKHGIVYTKRKCQRCVRCGTGVDNEHHLLFECSHVALVASRSKHRALFEGVRDVREWMAAAYKPELAANLSFFLSFTLGSCMQDMMHCLKAGLRASQTSHRLLSWADVTINEYIRFGRMA
jgi:hypothetical protein